jgi:hypothetical protein
MIRPCGIRPYQIATTATLIASIPLNLTGMSSEELAKVAGLVPKYYPFNLGDSFLKLILILFTLASIVSIAGAYTDQQKTDISTGLRLSFQLGQAYLEAKQGINITQFNTLVDQVQCLGSPRFRQRPKFTDVEN